MIIQETNPGEQPSTNTLDDTMGEESLKDVTSSPNQLQDEVITIDLAATESSSTSTHQSSPHTYSSESINASNVSFVLAVDLPATGDTLYMSGRSTIRTQFENTMISKQTTTHL